MIQADATMHDRVLRAIKEDLVDVLGNRVENYAPVAEGIPENFRIGDIEDANVLIQNSIWLNVPLGELDKEQQVTTLRDRIKWAENQVEQIHLFKKKFDELAQQVEAVCV